MSKMNRKVEVEPGAGVAVWCVKRMLHELEREAEKLLRARGYDKSATTPEMQLETERAILDDMVRAVTAMEQNYQTTGTMRLVLEGPGEPAQEEP